MRGAEGLQEEPQILNPQIFFSLSGLGFGAQEEPQILNPQIFLGGLSGLGFGALGSVFGLLAPGIFRPLTDCLVLSREWGNGS